MTPTESKLLEALRPFAALSSENARLATYGNSHTRFNEEDFARARRLVEEYEGQAEEEFRRLAPLVDANPDWYGRTFYERHKVFTIIGIKVNRPKNVMAIRDHTGKVFKCTVDYVHDRVGKTTPAPRPRTRTRAIDLGA